MIIEVKGEEMCQEEQQAYAKMMQDKHPTWDIKKMTITIDGEFVDIKTEYDEVIPFERIRRITGYLVGSLNRFNDGKRAEERDRVKHGITE
jgi:inhibitor of KinA sporulation pathway (predicted exonuclease)